MPKNLFVKYKEVINYLIFGALTTIVSLGSFEISDRILGQKLYLVSNVISWILAVLFAYFTNKLWVFESKSWEKSIVIKEMAGFFGARLFSLGTESLGLWILITLLNVGALHFDVFSFTISGNMIAKLVMQIVVLVLNYVFSKFMIFAKKGKNKDDAESDNKKSE